MEKRTRSTDRGTWLILVVAVATLAASVAGCDSRANSQSRKVIESPSAQKSWVAETAEDVVRLPEGRVRLCSGDAVVISDCPTAQWLVADWPIERVLHEYPFFDPDEAVQLLWAAAERRARYEQVGDTRIWEPNWIATRLAERDSADARIAALWGTEWRKFDRDPDYAASVEQRRAMFAIAQLGGRDGDRPTCDAQRETLDYLAICELAEFISMEWTVDRALKELRDFREIDAVLIMEAIRNDALDRQRWSKNPVQGDWSPEKLADRLTELSRDLNRARLRLSTTEGFGFLRVLEEG